MTIQMPKKPKRRKVAKKVNRPLPEPDTMRNGKRVADLPTIFERLASRK